MTPKIVLPTVALLVAFAIGSGDALQCYECIAVGEASDDCKPEILMKDENAKTTCSINTMSEWHNKLAGHSSLSGIARVFRVDGNGQSSHSITPQTPMSCVKMVLRVDNQPVTLRTCQDSNIPGVNQCRTLESKIMEDPAGHAKVVHCSLCEGDKCNGSYLLSPTMILSIVPLLGSILMSLAYNSA